MVNPGLTPGFKDCAELCYLHGAGHAATALDGMADAADLVPVAGGDGLFERWEAFVEVGYDGRVDLAYGGLGHELPELGKCGGINHQLGVRGLRLVDLGIVLA
ncbi:MAG: hypothetical protein WBX19_11575, partial [Terracidiphilus sp.]